MNILLLQIIHIIYYFCFFCNDFLVFFAFFIAGDGNILDKFGIFKLLNSFCNLYGQNSASQTSNEKSSESGEKFLNALSGLFSNGKSAARTEDKPENIPNSPKKQKPLQSDMIAVMQSHDAFVNRVKNKHSDK